MSQGSRKYYFFQISGWLTFVVANVTFAGIFDKFTFRFVSRIFMYALIGFWTTHLMRYVIIRLDVLLSPLSKQLRLFGILTVGFAIILGLAETGVFKLLHLKTSAEGELSLVRYIIVSTVYAFIFIFFWNVIYFLYHYIAKNRKQELEALKLEILARELELKNIKSSVSPNFIFDALESIQQLIIQDPSRARHAITGLSNIMRSSLRKENVSSITLGSELELVKDYLDLEQIRLGENLKTCFEIDDEALDLRIPPMLLHRLVENAIKCFCTESSERKLDIVAEFKDHHLEICVEVCGNSEIFLTENQSEFITLNKKLQSLYGDRVKLSNPKIIKSNIQTNLYLDLDWN